MAEQDGIQQGSSKHRYSEVLLSGSRSWNTGMHEKHTGTVILWAVPHYFLYIEGIKYLVSDKNLKYAHSVNRFIIYYLLSSLFTVFLRRERESWKRVVQVVHKIILGRDENKWRTLERTNSRRRGRGCWGKPLSCSGFLMVEYRISEKRRERRGEGRGGPWHCPHPLCKLFSRPLYMMKVT